MKVSWQVVYSFLYLYRSFVSIFIYIVLSGVTTLGDSQTYVTGGKFDTLLGGEDSPLSIGLLIDSPRKFSTQLVLAMGYYLNSFIGIAIVINLIFQTIAFIGIIAVLKALEPQHRKWLLFLFMLPSFTIWSSIAGKEAIVVLAVGIISAYLINLTKKNQLPKIKEIISAFIVLLFKTQYLPGILFIYLTLTLGNKIRQKGFIVLLAGLVSLSLIYIERDTFNKITLEQIPMNYKSGSGVDGLAGGRSTREVFWEKDNDYIYKSPKGMIMSIVGPTYKEALLYNNKLHLFGFIEGMIIIIILAVSIFYHAKKASPILLIAVIFTLFWILFATYPLSVMNPGTAIRYRTGILPFIGVLAIYFLSQTAHIRWLKK